MGFGLCFAFWCGLDCSPAADKVHDDGDQSKEEQQVNEEAADMQDEESSQPE
jgi:hypothetical protein